MQSIYSHLKLIQFQMLKNSRYCWMHYELWSRYQSSNLHNSHLHCLSFLSPPLQFSRLEFMSGLTEVEERGRRGSEGENCEDCWTDICSKVHSASNNIVNFWAFGIEFSTNGCIWIAYSISTVYGKTIFKV